MNYEFDWSAVWSPDAWIDAIMVTVAYGVATTIAGLILGLGLGLLLISRFRVARQAVSLFIGVFRCTPALIQIVWFYYAFPMALGVTMPAWLAASCGLTFYMAAFSAEIFRGGIQSIEKGQWNACRSLCMSHWQTMCYVILPQTFRRMTPAIVNQSIIQFKNTSLLSVVSVHDLMFTASALTSETYRPLEVFTFAALLYILLIWPLASLAHLVERRIDNRSSH
ncbi:amino acid ABC transporter permease [Phyllobacterium sp. SB3]|uniref:amino acid ABC transporter permease n=1 Tax=Phyllobacterium sp. SB3 TaxID=3156073 RepID=UPI0032AF8C98